MKIMLNLSCMRGKNLNESGHEKFNRKKEKNHTPRQRNTWEWPSPYHELLEKGVRTRTTESLTALTIFESFYDCFRRVIITCSSSWKRRKTTEEEEEEAEAEEASDHRPACLWRRTKKSGQEKMNIFESNNPPTIVWMRNFSSSITVSH